MCSARSSNDPVFFSHHANVDKVFGARGTNLTWKVEEGEAVLAGNSDRLASFTPTTDLPDGDYYLQDKSDPIESFSLNFEEIKVIYQGSENSWNDCSPADNVVLEDVGSVIQKHCE